MVHFSLALRACVALHAACSGRARYAARHRCLLQRPKAPVQNQVHFGQASSFPSVQCLHWTSLSCAVQMTGGAYVCFYSSISKGWLQGGACTFPVCLAKKLILESTREPYSPAECAILMFTKDTVLSKTGEHRGRWQHYFPAPGFAQLCFSFCHSMTVQLAYSCTAWVPAL